MSNNIDWENLKWEEYTNKEIVQGLGVCYATAHSNRRRYGSHTLKKYKKWDKKVREVLRGNQDYVIADNFKEQAAARNAAYNYGYTLKGTVTKTGKWHMYAGDKRILKK
jgi:hypothetical protein